MTGPRLLVVCVGNVCRSPLAERLLAARLPDGSAVASAGVGALVGAPMDPGAAAELEARGGSAEGFVARALTAAMVAEADVVLTATLAVRSRVLEAAPAGLRRTFTLRELALLLEDAPADEAWPDAVARAARERSRVARGDLDVADPYRRGPAAHAEAAAQVEDAVRRLVAALAPDKTPHEPPAAT